MKLTSLVLLASVLIATTVQSQITTTPAPIGSIGSSNIAANVSPSLGGWQALQRDAGSTVWQRIQLGTNQVTGQLELQTNRYTQIANNLNFLNAAGVWEESSDRIELMSTNVGGAGAVKSPTKVYFPPTLNGSDGPITITSASNTVVKTQPIGLYYFDAQSGKRVLLGSAQSADGELVGMNQVVYRNIFQGIACDLRITYNRGACESDLIMLARPKPPESFGLNGAYCRLELWHALDAPVPQQSLTVVDSVTNLAFRATMAEPDFTDSTLDFQGLRFPQGRAFSWNGLAPETSQDLPVQVHLPSPKGNDGDVVVAKKYVQTGNGTALVESVRWTDIEPYLASLPLMAQASGSSGSIQQASFQPRMPRLTKPVNHASRPMKIARGGYQSKGFVLDYITISGTFGSYTFSNQTYFISGNVSFSSTVNFNAGCILKYANGAYLIIYDGPINCYGTQANPSILTSMNDPACGEQILGSTGYPSYCANPAVWLYYIPTTQTLNWMQIRWAKTGIENDVTGTIINNVYNSSFEWCQTAFNIDNGTLALSTGDAICSVGTTFAGNGTYTGSVVDKCTGDADNNGLPDSWEYEYFGRIGISPSGDPDGDGLSNIQEYNCGTNPQVSDRPTIQPPNPVFARGENVTLTANVAGTQPQSYQWSLSGVNIAGATTSAYTINNVQLANSGYYVVTVGYSNVLLSSAYGYLSVVVPTSGTPAPSGIVGWWPGNGNANDAVSTNNGNFTGSYTNGEVGQAFNVIDTSSCVRIPAATALNIGTGSGLTVEGWIYPYDLNGIGRPIIEWAPTNSYGMQVWSSFQYPGNIFVNIPDTNGNNHYYYSASGLIAANAFQHLAVTYDKTSGNSQLYINGVLQTTQSLGVFIPQTTPDVYLGCRPSTVNGTAANFNGRIDEVSIYNRVLAASEIQAIYSTGAGGKYSPPAPPTITTQPQNQVVALGGNATFTVGVSGPTPYSYQWTFNGGFIAGATLSSYTVANVQSGNLGNYAVVVANAGGSVASASASLTTSMPCVALPSGALTWWRAENNPNDSFGANNGQFMGTTTYANGEKAQAFSFNGASSYVTVPSNSSLQLSNQFTLELWYKDTGSPGWYGLIAKRSSTGSQPCNFGINALAGNYMQVYFLDPTTQPGYQVSTISPLPSVNTFHHLAATFQQINSSQIQIQTYIDGAWKKSDTFNGNLAGTFDNSPVTIGASNSTGEWFTGLIDEVSIYSRALSAGEIAAIYTAGASGKCYDSDGDGVPDWMDASPYDPGVGILNITIDSPANGSIVY